MSKNGTNWQSLESAQVISQLEDIIVGLKELGPLIQNTDIEIDVLINAWESAKNIRDVLNKSHNLRTGVTAEDMLERMSVNKELKTIPSKAKDLITTIENILKQGKEAQTQHFGSAEIIPGIAHSNDGKFDCYKLEPTDDKEQDKRAVALLDNGYHLCVALTKLQASLEGGTMRIDSEGACRRRRGSTDLAACIEHEADKVLKGGYVK